MIRSLMSGRPLSAVALGLVLLGVACGRIDYSPIAPPSGAAGGGGISVNGRGGASGTSGAGGSVGGGSGVGGAAGTAGSAGAAGGGKAGAGGNAGAGGSAGAGGRAGTGGIAGAAGRGGAGGSGGTGVGGAAGAGSAGMAGTGGLGGAACAPATFGGHVYAFCAGPLNWMDAGSDCAAKGMRLVRVDDDAENAWVASTAFAGLSVISAAHWPWIGADDLAVVGEWRWADGALFWLGGSNGAAQGGLYANWLNNSPTDVGAATDCGMLQSSTLWRDFNCSSLQPYLCEQY
jgi:hypothetical protein